MMDIERIVQKLIMDVHLLDMSTVNEHINDAGPTMSDVDVRFRTEDTSSDLSLNTASHDEGCATHHNIEFWATR